MKSEKQIQQLIQDLKAAQLGLSSHSVEVVAKPVETRTLNDLRFLHLGSGTPAIQAMQFQIDTLEWILK